jgi:hypothetical protein
VTVALSARALVDSWEQGRAVAHADGRVTLRSVDIDPMIRLRRAAAWLSDTALGTAHADLESGDAQVLGSGDVTVVLKKSPACSSAPRAAARPPSRR